MQHTFLWIPQSVPLENLVGAVWRKPRYHSFIIDFPIQSQQEGMTSYIVPQGSCSQFLVPCITGYDFKPAFQVWHENKCARLKELRAKDGSNSSDVEFWHSKARPLSVVDLDGWNRSADGMMFKYSPNKQVCTLLRSDIPSTASNPTYPGHDGSQSYGMASFSLHSNMHTVGSNQNTFHPLGYYEATPSNHSGWPVQNSQYSAQGLLPDHMTTWPQPSNLQGGQQQLFPPVEWSSNNPSMTYYYPGYPAQGYFSDPGTRLSFSSGTQWYDGHGVQIESTVGSLSQGYTPHTSGGETRVTQPVEPRSGSPLIVHGDVNPDAPQS